jgi:hypothetical protein
MNIESKEWRRIASLSGDDLKKEVFEVMKLAALSLQSMSSDDPAVLEVIPRLSEIVPVKEELKSFRVPLSALARASGLWNYIDKENADTADLLVAEAVTAPELDGITLHREQISVLNDLLSGANVILSAPTSFGKSLLIDALLASGKYQRIAIVLPTIALLDEFRRRLRKRFAAFGVIMHPNEVPGEGPTIFLGTQERLINRDDLGKLDLTVVDEFYKLDPRRKDERSMTLNAAVYKLLNKSRQFFFLGPNIDNVQFASDGRWKFQFLKTRFSMVAVDTFDLRGVENKQERLFEEVGDEANWPALVFVSSPDKANDIAQHASEELAVSDQGADFSAWIADNVGPRSPLVSVVRFGFAMHHGRLPRAIASHMVRSFNTGRLPVLFCTSTLIEGVNTAAKTVLIYDKAINRTDYDFFTFSNIKGRAGRLGQHHVGKVYLFNEPPPREETEIAPTLFAEDDDAPDDYVVYLDEVQERSNANVRLNALKTSLGLDATELRTAAAIGLEDAAAVKAIVKRELAAGADIAWTGYPTYDQISVLCAVACEVRKPNDFGARSYKQLSFFIHRLRMSHTMRTFLRSYDQSYRGDSKGYDNVFKFLRSCEYGLPQLFAVMEMFIKQDVIRVDYSLFLRELARWFRPEELKNLDEEGVPIQISERFYAASDTRESLMERLGYAVRTRSQALSSFERAWVAAALDINGVDPG